MIPVLLVIGMSLMLPAQNSRAEDLWAVFHLALERDPQFAAAAAARDSALESVPQAKAGFLPTVTAATGLNFNNQKVVYGNAAALGPTGSVSGQQMSYPSHNYSLNITQPIYHRETSLALRQADSRVGQANAEYGAARQDLIVRSAQGYFDVLAALDSLDTAKAEKLAVGRQLDQSKQRFEVGIIAITDVHEAQAGYDLAVAQEIAAENQVANAREALRAIIGAAPSDALAPLGDENLPLVSTEPASADRWADTALAQNLTLEATRAQVETARNQVEIQRSGHYPHIDAVGSTSLQKLSGGSAAGSTETDSTVIGLQISIPLYQGGIISSRIRQSGADLARAQDLLEQEQRATVLSARKSYLGVIAGISQVKALRQAVISNQSALQATEAGYQVGTRTIVDVLNSQRLLFAAERDYSQSRYNYVLNTLRLKQAAGQLNDADLQAINTWLGENKGKGAAP